MTKKTDQPKMNRETPNKWPWALIIIVFCLAAIGYFGRQRLVELPTKLEVLFPRQSDQNAIREKIEREAAAILADTDRKNKEAYETAMAELAGINGAFDRAREGIAPLVDELASFKGCAILCYLMTKDKFSGNCETEARIQSVLDAHIGQNILHAGQQRETALARLNDALARNTTDMQVRLASMTETVLGSEDETAQAAFRDLSASISTVSQGFSGIAVSTVISGTGLAISALLAKTSLKQARNVLGHIARRIGTTTALAIGSAAADGPLPIGDVIGLVLEVGGATWCAYELYDAQFILRDQVAGDLRRALAQYRGEFLDLGKKQFLELLKAYHSRNLKIAQNLTNPLS
ncbi:MAG: hypothetical protein GY846_26935 [Deltaproteobacteria bacterium]|nr:hypothetical protein [Deltaproteobacteria bacterium]